MNQTQKIFLFDNLLETINLKNAYYAKAHNDNFEFELFANKVIKPLTELFVQQSNLLWFNTYSYKTATTKVDRNIIYLYKDKNKVINFWKNSPEEWSEWAESPSIIFSDDDKSEYPWIAFKSEFAKKEELTENGFSIYDCSKISFENCSNFNNLGNVLKDKYSSIGKSLIDDFKTINTCANNISDKNIAKVITYFCWIHWAYPEWKALVNVPAGVVSQVIPYTVSVGFSNSNIDSNYLFFLKEIVSLIFHSELLAESNRIVNSLNEARKEIEKKINLLEQTYHDVTRRYLPTFERKKETEGVAKLLGSKINYLMNLARGERPVNESKRINVKDEINDLFRLLDYDLKDNFILDDDSLKSLENIEINTYPGAFRTLFENLIGNTCKHAWNGTDMVTIFISCGVKNNEIIYTDNGLGYPNAVDDVPILEKIKNCWFKGIFSNEDIAQKNNKGTIRGMGLYIIEQASVFLSWKINSEIAKELPGSRVQIKYHISWV